jgi:hypothetical protein
MGLANQRAGPRRRCNDVVFWGLASRRSLGLVLMIGCRHLLVVQVHPGLMSWGILSRPCGTGLGGIYTQDLRPGLLSAVPSGLSRYTLSASLFQQVLSKPADRNRRSLRYAPVGMTNLRAVAHLGMGGGGWTESRKELIWTTPLRNAF